MKKTALICIMLILASFAIASTWDEDTRVIKRINDLRHDSGRLGAYRALIFGIDDYKDPFIPDLKTAVKDARAMSEVLQDRYGFKTKLILNRKATRAAMYNALMDAAAEAGPDESIILYYAGHGELDRKFKNSEDGWWIPADAKAGDPTTYLDNFQVQKAMKNTKAKHVLLISDSCYAGTLFGRARAMPPTITDNYYLGLYNETSRWGITSGNKEPVSDRGTKGHSIFAYQLLKALHQNTKPYFSVLELYADIAPIIGNNSEQTPLCLPVRMTGDQGGGFVFVLAENKSEAPVRIQSEKKCRLTVTSNVPGSVVWIGGSKLGEAPVSVYISKAGDYVIKAAVEGYEDFEVRKFVDLSGDVEVKATLKTKPDIVRPYIINQEPKPYAKDIKINEITVKFSEPIKIDTPTHENFIVYENSQIVAGTLSYYYYDKKAVFTPETAFNSGHTYTIVLTEGIKDKAGNSLKKYQWQFTTFIPPVIKSTFPKDKQLDVAIDLHEIKATFSEEIQEKKLEEAFALIDSNGASIVGHVYYDAGTKTAIFVLKKGTKLKYSTTYTVKVSKRVKDLAGNPMSEDKLWKFTTEKNAYLGRIKQGEDTTKTTNYNPILNYHNYPVKINEKAFAIEKYECSDISGHWVLLYEGIVTDEAEENVFLQLKKRFGYRFHPEKEGIDSTDWSCKPMKRHCYSSVKFEDWQGKYYKNQVISFPKSHVYNAKISLINGIYDFLKQNCNR